jgi:hypothetical protein
MMRQGPARIRGQRVGIVEPGRVGENVIECVAWKRRFHDIALDAGNHL